MQKTISLSNITFSIREKSILQGVSFRCSENERVCIFGENGAGKSTLLKILCGELQQNDGRIEKQGHIRFVYVTQEFDQAFNERTVDEYIRAHGGMALSKKVYTHAKILGFDAERYKTTLCKSLSGGQQKILALSAGFASSPDFILLDEPENHLDIVSRMELVSLLQSFKGGVIFISHDRLLIDAVATKVCEIADGKLQMFEGKYDDYIDMKMKRIGGLQRQYDAETKRIKRLSTVIVLMYQKAFRGVDIPAYRKYKAELEKLKQEHKESGRPEKKKTKITLSQTEHKLHDGKLLCRMKDGMFKYEDAKAKTFDKADLEIRAGDKIVLLGRNGSGKSTFLKCLQETLPLSSGTVSWASGIVTSYFDQHAEFDPERTAVEIVKEKLNCLDIEAQSALGAMKFDVMRMKCAVKDLSGGERMRLRFALVFGQKPDFIIFDEPTNHIDETTWEILLQACIESKSSILLVSHDYGFIKAFNPKLFWMLHKQKVMPRYKELEVLLEEMKQD